MKQLEASARKVEEVAAKWSKQQEYRDDGFGGDQWYVQSLRYKLEKAIIEYRVQLAKIYDFTGDSGLR